MNMIDYNKAVEALEKERQYLLNREQYGAENALVKHAINVIHKLPIIRQPEVVYCKDCEYWDADEHNCNIKIGWFACGADWFCADGKKRSDL